MKGRRLEQTDAAITTALSGGLRRTSLPRPRSFAGRPELEVAAGLVRHHR